MLGASQSTQKKIYTITGGSAIVGICIGVLFAYLEKFGGSLIGMWLGTVVGMLIYDMGLSNISQEHA